MKQYVTAIEYMPDTQMYRAHVRESNKQDNLYSSNLYQNIEEALSETQKFFMKITKDNEIINSTNRNLNVDITHANGSWNTTVRKSCCGR